MKRSGIDISIWQQYPDYDKLKKDPNVDFVIAQIGYGRYSYQKDETFEYNYKNAKSHGVPIGGYWFSYANSPNDAREEARACLEIIKDRQFEYPIYYDIEGNALQGDVSGKCKAFCSELEKNGWFDQVRDVDSRLCESVLLQWRLRHMAVQVHGARQRHKRRR